MKIRTIIAALAATLMLTGCCEVSAPTIHTEPVPTTVSATEALEDFKFGQEVWCVEGDGDAYLVRYAVVGQNGELVKVVPYFTSDVQQLRESMGDASLIEIDQVYQDKVAAMIAVAEANGESFEMYWGCAVEDVTNE